MKYIKMVLFIGAAFSLAFLINWIPEVVTQAQDVKKVQGALTEKEADKIIAALKEKASFFQAESRNDVSRVQRCLARAVGTKNPSGCNVMARYLGEIRWETEVWVADSPSHLIHFDGDRFLGPYEK